MHANLIKVLKHMSDIDFQELHHNMKIANKMRRIKHEFVLDYEDFADELNVQVPEVKNMMNAAYNFDIRMVSKIDVFEKKLLEEEEVFSAEGVEEEEEPQHEQAEHEEEGVFENDEEQDEAPEAIKLNKDDDVVLHAVEDKPKKKDEPTSSDTNKSSE